MKAVIQKVTRGSVKVDNEVLSSIGKGLVVLIGVSPEDTEEDCEKVSRKITTLRLWEDENGAMWKKNIIDEKAKVLCISQFTLYGKINKGAKPDFHGAAKGEQAFNLYQLTRSLIGKKMPNGMEDVGDGKFGAMMEVEIINDGPTTILYDTKSNN